MISYPPQNQTLDFEVDRGFYGGERGQLLHICLALFCEDDVYFSFETLA